MLFDNIVPRPNIGDYLIHDGTGKNAGLLKDPLPPLPENCPKDVPASVPDGAVVIDMTELFIRLKLDVVTYDELYRIAELLLRKEEANEGSIFRG